MSEFTPAEMAILNKIARLRAYGDTDGANRLLRRIEAGQVVDTPSIMDETVNPLWADVVRSRKITADMLMVGSGSVTTEKTETGGQS